MASKQSLFLLFTKAHMTYKATYRFNDTEFCYEIKMIEKRSCGLVTFDITEIQNIQYIFWNLLFVTESYKKSQFSKHKSQQSKFAKLQI